MNLRASIDKISIDQSKKDDGIDSTIASISRTSIANGFIIAAVLAGIRLHGAR